MLPDIARGLCRPGRSGRAADDRVRRGRGVARRAGKPRRLVPDGPRATRGQTVLPKPAQRVAVIETPGPHLAPPPPLPVVEVKIAPVGAEVSAIPVARETVEAAQTRRRSRWRRSARKRPPTVARSAGRRAARRARAGAERSAARRRAGRARKEARCRQESARGAHGASAQGRGSAPRRAGARQAAGRDVVVQQWLWKSELRKFRLRKHIRKAIDPHRDLAPFATCRAKPGAKPSTNSAPIS